jgi:hypothetical protein
MTDIRVDEITCGIARRRRNRRPVSSSCPSPMRRCARADRGQPRRCQSPSVGPAHLAGESVAVDIAEFVRSHHNERAGIIPNREEHLRGHSWGDRETCRLKGTHTFVIMTTFSLGMLCALSAFPRIRSDSPLEYTLAVSKVLMPLSYLCEVGAYVNDRPNNPSRLVPKTHANLICSSPSFSPFTHSSHLVEP